MSWPSRKSPRCKNPPHNSQSRGVNSLTKADVPEDLKMGPRTSLIRCARILAFSSLLLAGTSIPGFSAGPDSETIQATYDQAGNTINITLTIYGYSSPSDMQILSQAFQQGQDQALVTALSKTKAAGHCSSAGALNYDVAFIQMIPTPTGRRIIFITNRPLQLDEVNSGSSSSFDLEVGQFDLNDADASKNTGFLYPASKLVIDKEGIFRYDLAGNPLPLINVLDSRPTSATTEPSVADVSAPATTEPSVAEAATPIPPPPQ